MNLFISGFNQLLLLRNYLGEKSSDGVSAWTFLYMSKLLIYWRNIWFCKKNRILIGELYTSFCKKLREIWCSGWRKFFWVMDQDEGKVLKSIWSRVSEDLISLGNGLVFESLIFVKSKEWDMCPFGNNLSNFLLKTFCQKCTYTCTLKIFEKVKKCRKK